MSFQRASFGMWKLVVEYLGKQTRDLLSGNDDEGLLCAEIFSDCSNALPKTVSSKELANILAEANKMRNKAIGHGGIIGLEDAKRCNQQLLNNVQKLREVMADLWEETQLIQSTLCTKRKGVFENEVAILMGSNSEFLKESKTMSTCLDADLLYLLRKDETQALQLIPLMQIGPSHKSAINACYFYSKVDPRIKQQTCSQSIANCESKGYAIDIQRAPLRAPIAGILGAPPPACNATHRRQE